MELGLRLGRKWRYGVLRFKWRRRRKRMNCGAISNGVTLSTRFLLGPLLFTVWGLHCDCECEALVHHSKYVFLNLLVFSQLYINLCFSSTAAYDSPLDEPFSEIESLFAY